MLRTWRLNNVVLLSTPQHHVMSVPRRLQSHDGLVGCWEAQHYSTFMCAAWTFLEVMFQMFFQRRIRKISQKPIFSAKLMAQMHYKADRSENWIISKFRVVLHRVKISVRSSNGTTGKSWFKRVRFIMAHPVDYKYNRVIQCKNILPHWRPKTSRPCCLVVSSK